MGLFKKFLMQCRKPSGGFGRFIGKAMNSGHAKIRRWGLTSISINPDSCVLDIGCGGGKGVKEIASIVSKGKVYGIDYSQEMVQLSKSYQLLESEETNLLHEHNDNKVLVFLRSGLVFVFNFHPECSYVDYRFQVPGGTYQLIFNSDEAIYGGHDRLEKIQVYYTLTDESRPHLKNELSLYLPTRTALILKKIL